VTGRYTHHYTIEKIHVSAGVRANVPKIDGLKAAETRVMNAIPFRGKERRREARQYWRPEA
jgi:hypothetical protein